MSRIQGSPLRQRGIAAILILVLVGLSLTATMLGSVHYLRASQEQHTALHAQSIAQARAWTGAEALRLYLEAVAPEEWDGFEAGSVVPVLVGMDLEGVIVNRAELDNSTAPQHRRLTAELIGTAAKGTPAESASVLKVVYQIVPADTEGPDPRVINFRNGLNITGNLKVHTANEQSYEIVVDGDVSLRGLSVGGIDVIRSTRSIKFDGGSATDFREMHANCDIQVSNGSFSVHNVKATRNACLANTINSQSIRANGSVEVGGGSHGDISALANNPVGVAECAAGAETLCDISDTFGVRTKPTPTIKNIYSKGDVEFNSSVTVGNIRVEGDLRVVGCTPVWTSATYGGDFTHSGSCGPSASLSAQPVLLDPVPKVEVDPEVFDANTLRAQANYIYSRMNGVLRVKIQGMEGVGVRDSADEENPQEVRDNGYYYRNANIIDPNNPGWKNREIAGYACINNNTPSPKDEADQHCLVRLGKAYNDTTPMPNYVEEWDFTGWDFNGNSHAPGVVFAEGNIRLKGGTYTNTFIATGNLAVTPANKAVFALNYAGSDGIAIEGHTALGVCNNQEYQFRPVEFCRNGYNPGAHGGIGNYALLAGSCPPGSNDNGKGCTKGEYVGGDIEVAAAVFGAVKAGNLFNTEGNAKLYGFVSSLAQRSNTIRNELSASTTFDLRVPSEVQDRYDPTGVWVPPGDEDEDEAVGSAVILWSRYL